MKSKTNALSMAIIHENHIKEKMNTTGKIRQFETGATRNLEEGKLDFDGFLSPLSLGAFARYMEKHRVQADGTLRDSDNWQKQIPKSSYMKSGWRHFFDWWSEHRGWGSRDGMEDALCGLLFNAMGYLHEYLREKNAKSKGICRKKNQ